MCMEGIRSPDVDGVCERAGGGALTHFAEGYMNVLGGEGGKGNMGIVGDRLCMSEEVVWDVRREEFPNMRSEEGSITGEGEGGRNEFES